MVSEQVTQVFLVSLIAGTATGVGAIPIFFADRISHRVYDGALGFAAGVMFGASIFTLILPGLDIAETIGLAGIPVSGMLQVMIGILLGGVFLLVANRSIPHVHFRYGGGELDDFKRKAILVASSITLHNFPEGLAIGIAFGSGLEGVGLTLGLAIGVQNIPDGFAMAIPASKTDLPDWKNILYTTASGGVPEPIAAIIGYALVTVVTDIFPLAAGFAAGAMMAVIFREMIPASHGHDYSDFATLTFVTGFIVMLFIDTTFTV